MFTILGLFFITLLAIDKFVPTKVKASKEVERIEEYQKAKMSVEQVEYDLSMNHCEAIERYESIGIELSNDFVSKFSLKQFDTVEKAVQYIESQRIKGVL